MNLFISYAHGDYPDFIQQLIEDLSEQHHVWMDSAIRAGDNWSDEIDRGIMECEVFLFIKTPRSVSSDCYCRGEITFAQEYKKRIVVLSLDDTVTPSIVSSSQRIFMNNSINILGKLDDEGYDEDYENLCSELDRLEENGQNKSSDDELFHFDNRYREKDLSNWKMAPISVLDQIDHWFENDQIYMGVFGNAGSGKSTLSLAVHKHYPDNSAIHFIDYSDKKSTDPRLFLQHFVYCLSRADSEFDEQLKMADFEQNLKSKKSEKLFEDYLLKPVMESDRKYLIIVDAFDEISEKERRKEIAQLFFSKRPMLAGVKGKLKIMITSRNDGELKSLLASLGAFIIDRYETKNNDAIEAMIKKFCGDYSLKYDRSLLDKVLKQSGGDFLYVHFILEELKQMGKKDISDIKFPLGMKGVCQRMFDRIFPDEEYFEEVVSPILEIIVTAKTPIKILELQELCGINRRELRKLLKRMEMFVDVRNDEITFIHKSLCDWLESNEIMDKYYIDCIEGEQRLCEYSFEQLKKDMPADYVKEYGIEHLLDANKYDEIAFLMETTGDSFDNLFLSFAEDLIINNHEDSLVNIFSHYVYRTNESFFLTAETIKRLLLYQKENLAYRILSFYNDSDAFHSMESIISFYQARRDNQSTEKVKELGEKLRLKIKDKKLLADILCVLADAYREIGEYNYAESLYSESAELAKTFDLDSIYYDCKFALVDLLYVKGNNDESWRALNALKEDVSFNSPNIYAYKYYRQSGHLYHVEDQREEAFSAYVESLRIAEDLHYPMKQMEAANSVAESLASWHQAESYINICRTIYEKSGLNSLEYGKSFYIEADILFRDGNYKDAESAAAKSITILESVGYGGGSAHAHLARGKCRYMLEDYEGALQDLRLAHEHYYSMKIRPTFRLSSFAYILRCAEKLDKLNDLINIDNVSYYNPEEYPFQLQVYEYVAGIVNNR